MSTPAVSGFIAAMLQMDEDLTPQEIKDILRNNSETRGGASARDVTDRWNDQYGFGIIDGEMVMQAILGDNSGGGGDGNGTGPPPTGTEEWVIIETLKRIHGLSRERHTVFVGTLMRMLIRTAQLRK